MEQGYLAQVQALIDQKWKENPEEMKRVMAEIKAKEKKKAKVETPKRVSFDPQLTQELIDELNKEDWDDVDASKIKDLLDRGADLEAKDNDGNTPLHFASMRNDLELAKLLLDKGADLEANNECRRTPLHVATCWNRIEITKFLLERGADVEAKNVYGQTPLDLAESDEMEELLKKYMK
jgi:ankyrin repeat protein